MAVIDIYPYHSRCREMLQARRIQPSDWYLTWLILYEFLRVRTHPRVFRNPWSAAHAWSFVEAVLAAPALSILIPGERHTTVAPDHKEPHPEKILAMKRYFQYGRGAFHL
jgi:predicted nucleic acid-binding protein